MKTDNNAQFERISLLVTLANKIDAWFESVRVLSNKQISYKDCDKMLLENQYMKQRLNEQYPNTNILANSIIGSNIYNGLLLHTSLMKPDMLALGLKKRSLDDLNSFKSPLRPILNDLKIPLYIFKF